MSKGIYLRKESHRNQLLKAAEVSAARRIGKKQLPETIKLRVASRAGYRHSEETKIKIGLSNSIVLKGYKHPKEFGIQISKRLTGHETTRETRLKIGESNRGEKNGMYGKIVSEETRKKLREKKGGEKHPFWGKHHSDATKKKISEQKLISTPRGENSPHWISDRTKLQKYGDDNKDRRSSAYNAWRKSVWLRDGFKCKIGNPDCAGRIEAHHILEWRKYPELRYQINNGITLCHAHHPRKRAEEKRLSPYFQSLVSVLKEPI
ncbi:MAG: NUMOD3 domain-containing DNA-binding protein [Patescibacteria group bacterium]